MQLPSFRFITSFFNAPEPSAEEKLLAEASSKQERAHLYQRIHAHEELPFLVKAASWMLTGQTAARAVNPNNPNEAWIINQTVEVAEKLNIEHVPGIFIVESPVPNAASLDGDHMIITRGLLNAMPPNQVTAVIGHELAHHRHNKRDRIGMWGSATLGAAVGLVSGLFASRAANLNRGLSNSMAFGLGYLGSSFGHSRYSQSIEYESDLEAALVTSPADMKGALESLEKAVEKLKAEESAKQDGKSGNQILRKITNFIRSPFATHPTTEKRIERLEALDQNPEKQEALKEVLFSEKEKNGPSSRIHAATHESPLKTAEQLSL